MTNTHRAAFVAAVLSAAAFGCSEAPAAGPLGPPAARIDTPPAAALSDTGFVVDTAYVPKGHAEDFVGAIVEEDGTITKNGVNIGSLTAPGPIGPTGTTGGGSSGDAGGVAAEKTRPPGSNLPAAELWCMVRVWLDEDGTIVHAEILYCWDDGGSGGGGGGGGEGEGDVPFTFDLTCREVLRGTSGGCTVLITDENGDLVDPTEFNFEWSSSGGSEDSGDGKDRWEGTATGPVTVTVEVDDGAFKESQTVGILKRFGWRLPSLASGTHYAVLQPNRHGQYDMTATGPTVARGGGPWDGMGYVKTAPSVTGRLWVHSDYSTGGGDYPKASAVQCATGVPDLASYYDVNSACNTWGVVEAWHDDIVIHEQDHEKGFNKCIESAGPTLMSMLEALSGPYAQVEDDMDEAWDLFETKLDAAGEYARAVRSGNFYLVTGGKWVLGFYSHPGESGPHGC